ncbi:hypothetical protein Y024_5763 [Burkholderia pseudomallei TSV44]|nr:hypothetical protein Y024_5763 [Burkholderia pseudomallei TSV44]
MRHRGAFARGSNTNGRVSVNGYGSPPRAGVCEHAILDIASTAARSAAAFRLLVVTVTFSALPDAVIIARTSTVARRSSGFAFSGYAATGIVHSSFAASRGANAAQPASSDAARGSARYVE